MRFRASGLIKGLSGLVWFRSRLGTDEPLAVFGAGSAIGSGTCSGWVDLRRGGLGFRGGNGIARLYTCGLVLLFAEPLSGVDICFDGRGRGLRRGLGKAAVRDQAFDGCDR
jgi:hypothetical protein